MPALRRMRKFRGGLPMNRDSRTSKAEAQPEAGRRVQALDLVLQEGWMRLRDIRVSAGVLHGNL
jgi:hypothetical protein